MKKIADVLVKTRNYILAGMILITIISVFLMKQVNVVSDMTKYLPDNSSMKQGIDIMNEQFPVTESEQTIRVMADDINAAQKEQLLKELQDIENVSSVDYELDNDAYNKDNYTLYILNTKYDYDSEEFKNITEHVSDMQTEWSLCYDTGDTAIGGVPPMIILLAFVILMIILFIMCNSWVEPFLFLITIGIAIIINMGTNAFFSGVSQITYSIAAILQLVLSMDYSIILMNRYRQELEKTDKKELAMSSALGNAFSSITSSSLTTFVGLLALIFMNFKIGADMGIVLAKGVLISLICIFTVLPALILMFDGLIKKTAKSSLVISMKSVSRFSFHGRYVISGLFAVLFVVLCFLKGNTEINYSMISQDKIAEIFPKENTFVVVYNNRDEAYMQNVAEKLTEDKNIKNVSAYATTLGKKYSITELRGVLQKSGITEENMIDDSMLQMIFYVHFRGDENPKMTLAQFFDFMQNFITEHKEYASMMEEQDSQQLQSFATLLQNPEYADMELTASELYQMIGQQNSNLDENKINLMYQLYFSQNEFDDSWKMSMEELFAQIKEMNSNDVYAALLPESLDSTVQEAEKSLKEGKEQLVGKEYSRMILTTTFPEESEETTQFLAALYEELSNSQLKESYVIGNSAMEYEMAQTFHSELNKISWITMAAIFVVILLTFRSVGIPLILVVVIQGAVYATMVVMNIFGGGIYYLALLIVQSILMGATIDYGILFSNYYRENRKSLAVAEALTAAYDGSIHTIMTSGLIMVLVTFILGYAFSNPVIGQICHIISAGVLIAIILVLFVLPGIICALDDKCRCK